MQQSKKLFPINTVVLVDKAKAEKDIQSQLRNLSLVEFKSELSKVIGRPVSVSLNCTCHLGRSIKSRVVSRISVSFEGLRQTLYYTASFSFLVRDTISCKAVFVPLRDSVVIYDKISSEQ